MGSQLAGYASSSNTLLNFRTGYIKFIANAWADPEGELDYLKKYLNVKEVKKDIYLTSNILDCPEFTSLLPAGSDSLPWTAKVCLLLDPKTGPTWSESATAGWLGAYDNFTIVLPPAPADKDQYEAALAAYFQMFPTFLGHDYGKSEVNGSAADFVDFGNVLLQAIAQSWSNQKFNGYIDGKESEYTFKELLIANGVDCLTRFYGYNNPWNFSFVFKEAECVEWKPGENNEAGKWDDEEQLYNTIILSLPNKPASKKDDDVVGAVALASYNASGAHYPFTCP